VLLLLLRSTRGIRLCIKESCARTQNIYKKTDLKEKQKKEDKHKKKREGKNKKKRKNYKKEKGKKSSNIFHPDGSIEPPLPTASLR
jgi:hypothetical protein